AGVNTLSLHDALPISLPPGLPVLAAPIVGEGALVGGRAAAWVGGAVASAPMVGVGVSEVSGTLVRRQPERARLVRSNSSSGPIRSEEHTSELQSLRHL